MPTNVKFWDKIADKYYASPISDPAAYEEKLRRTQALLKPDMRVLEFGCGTGGTALRHAGHVRAVLATDLSPKMIEIAKTQARDQGVHNVEFEAVNIDALEAREASFDAVLGMSIIHLVNNRNATLRKVHQLLKPGGVFISSTACLGDHMAWLRFVLPIGQMIGKVPMVRIFKHADLVQSMEAAGFELESVWQPEKRNKAGDIIPGKTGMVSFIIARKPGSTGLPA